MATRSFALATILMPLFQENVLRRTPRTYGYYAAHAGLDVAKESILIGKAMHAIGAACVMTRTPIAPLRYVERADGEWQGIFEKTSLERTAVKPHWTVLSVTSRDHVYTVDELNEVNRALTQVVPKFIPESWSPERLWKYLIEEKLETGQSWFERAMEKYDGMFDDLRIARNAGRSPSK